MRALPGWGSYATQRPVSPQQRLLGQIGGLMGVADHPQRVRVQAILVASCQGIERREVPAQAPRGQRPIVLAAPRLATGLTGSRAHQTVRPLATSRDIVPSPGPQHPSCVRAPLSSLTSPAPRAIFLTLTLTQRSPVAQLVERVAVNH